MSEATPAAEPFVKPTPHPDPERRPTGIPPSVASEFLLTRTTGLKAVLENGVWIASYNLYLEVLDKLPDGAFLEARFEDPGDLNALYGQW